MGKEAMQTNGTAMPDAWWQGVCGAPPLPCEHFGLWVLHKPSPVKKKGLGKLDGRGEI